MRQVEGGIRLHLVLKFRYDEEIIEPVLYATKPARDYEKVYGSPVRIFPFCIFNSTEEVPISWTYQCRAGRVYERIEMYATVTMIRHDRFFPFELKLLALKVLCPPANPRART